MDEREWQTFLTVVEEGNITRAANRLFISQPALTYRLRHMEQDLGMPLLLRSNDGIVLTPAGEVFKRYCQRMLQERAKLDEEMNTASGKIQGTIKIGTSINFADYELPKLLGEFRKKYPDIHIHVRTGFSHQVAKSFNAGECMIAFVRGDYKGNGHQEVLVSEPYCHVYKELVPYVDLVKIPYIRYQTDHSLENVIENWCALNLDGQPDVAMEVNSMTTCRHFVREGLGWSILTYMGLGSCKDKDIVVRPLLDSHGKRITRDTKMIYSDTAQQLVAVKVFLDFVREYYKQHTVVDESIFVLDTPTHEDEDLPID